MKNILILTLLLIIPTQFLSAQDIPTAETINQEIMNNVSHEFTDCAGYYMIAKEALFITEGGESETTSRFQIAVDNLLMAAQRTLSGTGKSEEMVLKIVASRLELTVKDMGEEIGNDVSNISVLMTKYTDRCKKILENPNWILVHWTNKVGEKYGINSTSQD